MKQPLPFLLLLLFSLGWLQTNAQTRILTGTVKNAIGTPIVGATIIVLGTSTGAYSDNEGNFTFAVNADAKTLSIKYVGMKTKEVAIGADNTINITMEEDALGLDEVVVTANAINREKRALGYATTQVTGDNLNSGDNSNMLGALEGKVAGVDITSLTGGPGSSDRIVIRGGTSLTRNNQALLVVDGVPIDNSNEKQLTPDGTQSDDLNNQIDYGNRGNDINPDDIESISVLKGPAAAALYGSRASNGALIITTKKGKHGVSGNSKIDVTVHSSITFSSPLKLPDFQTTYGQGNTNAIVADPRENFSWSLPFNGQLRPWGQQLPIGPNGALEQQVKPYQAIPNDMRNFFNVGDGWRNNVSFSGGGQKTTYYLSIGSLNSTSIVPGTEYDKYNVLFNASSELSNHFTSSISLNYSTISSKLPTSGQGNQSPYLQLLETPVDIPITDGKNLSNPFNAYNPVTNTYGFYAAYSLNPYESIQLYNNTNNVDRLFGNVNLNYNPIKGLNITDRFGADVYSDRRYEEWAAYDFAPIDPFYEPYNQTYQGKYSQDIFNLTSYNNDLMASYTHDIAKDFAGTILVGQNIRQSSLTEVYAQTNDQGGLALPGYYNLSNSNGPALDRNSLLESRNIGYYADLSLSYKKMLFLDLTGRNDQSSTLPAANNSYFYPSASASWVFSELYKQDSKFKNNIWSYGKLRASYAKVGNDAPPYVTTNTFQVTNIAGAFGNTQFPFNGIPGYTQSDLLGNPDIKPEFTTAEEVGTELGFFKDRLSIDFSLYMNKSTNQIIDLPLPPSSGFTAEEANTGDVQNKGVELAVRGVPIQTKSGFKWELYGTYTQNQNEVVSLANGVQQITLGGLSDLAIVAQVGKPYGAFYGVDLLKNSQGQVVVDPTTGLPQTTPNLVYLGNYQPKFIASWGTNLSYKGFTFGILFDTKQGGVFYSETKALMDFSGEANETTVNGRQDYVWPNSVNVSTTSESGYITNTTPFHPYDFYTSTSQVEAGTQMVDASYVKLREVSLAYKFPAKWLKKLPFGGITVSVFGNNLFLWTPKSNQYADPELNSDGASNVQGFEFVALPSQRNYGIDAKVTF